MKSIKKLVIIFLACFIFIIAFQIVRKNNIFNLEENKKYDIKYFAWQIKNKGYLVTSEIQYSGRINYKINENYNSDNNNIIKNIIKMLIYREFMMIFDTRIEAGVDLSNIELIETESKIIVKMPKATIKDIYIIPESIEYYDIDRAPIKWGESEKEAGNNAKIKAKEYVKDNVNLNTLLNNAQSQAEKYIEGILKVGTNKYIEFDIFDNKDLEETNIELLQQIDEKANQSKELDILQIVNNGDNVIEEKANSNINISEIEQDKE